MGGWAESIKGYLQIIFVAYYFFHNDHFPIHLCRTAISNKTNNPYNITQLSLCHLIGYFLSSYLT